MITVGELRKLIDGKADDEDIPLYVEYGEVDTNTIFLRTDALNVGRHNRGSITDPIGLVLTASLVDPECDEDDEDDEDDDSDPSALWHGRFDARELR